MSTDMLVIPLKLEVVAGPPVPPPVVHHDRETVIGRGEGCGIRLPDDTLSVSRRHASIEHRGSRWMVTDRESRHGTYLNGNKLSPQTPSALVENDLLTIGPWTFRVNLGQSHTMHTMSFDDSSIASQRVERLAADQTSRLAQHRLDLLINCAADITAATDEAELAKVVLACALDGSGFQRGALIRQFSGEVEVQILGHESRDGTDASVFQFSRSLLREATAGQMARLASLATLGGGSSVYELGITAAICAPIMLNAAPVAYLYLDTRGKRATVAGDATAFVQIITRLSGLALLNIKRLELKQREEALHGELEAARVAQQFILPPDTGQAHSLRYAKRVKPGRFVAGDLFDFLDLGPNKVAAFLGDVCGEGVGAAMLMAATQSHLHAALVHHGDPAEAVTIVNRYVAPRCSLGKFVSLWLGVFDLDRGIVEFVDAGHGHWLLKPFDGPARAMPSQGGLLLGVDGSGAYHSERFTIRPGDRIILYSDGVIDQSSPDGGRFGQDRLCEVIDRSTGPDDDVRLVFEAIEKFAGRTEFADDTTVASIEWTR